MKEQTNCNITQLLHQAHDAREIAEQNDYQVGVALLEQHERGETLDSSLTPYMVYAALVDRLAFIEKLSEQQFHIRSQIDMEGNLDRLDADTLRKLIIHEERLSYLWTISEFEKQRIEKAKAKIRCKHSSGFGKKEVDQILTERKERSVVMNQEYSSRKNGMSYRTVLKLIASN